MRASSLVVVLVASLAPCLAPAASGIAPLAYDSAADEACARDQRTPIDSAWIAELQSRLPEAQALWSVLGPRMFDAASKAVGRTVAPPSVPIRLTLCAVPSQSNWIGGPLVNMRFALSSFSAEPVPLRVKIDTAFHESLHPFVQRFAPARSPLLLLHAEEPSCVRNHLHLLSLQKAVLLSLGQARELADLIQVDERLPSGCYKRAWAIVNETPETYLRYVRELAGGT